MENGSMLMEYVMDFFGLFGAFYTVYYLVTCLGGFITGKRRTLPESEDNHRIAVIIPARNESAVIRGVVHSLKQQRYPAELFDIFVVPNNCTDDTETVAASAGALILHCTDPVSKKGDVLRQAFAQLSALEKYDTYCVFDADNLVAPDFLHQVNNARNAGYSVAQGFRDSKNPYTSWISGSMSVFYWFMSRFFNESRFRLGISSHLNGTGFMVGDEVISSIGWNTETLVEDLEFTAFCAMNGYKIGFMREARVYDEQPNSFWQSVIQRRRWTAGSLQCTRRYSWPLLKKHTAASLDIGILFLGNLLNYACLVSVPYAVMNWKNILTQIQENTSSVLTFGAVLLLIVWFLLSLFAASMFLMEKKFSVRSLPAVILFPLFMASWTFINLYAAFTAPPEWKKIVHGVSTLPQVAADDADID